MEGGMRRSVVALVAFLTAGFGLATAGCEHLPRTRADLVRSASPCEDTHFTVYFNEGSNRLTRQAGQVIQETGRAMKECTIVRARVLGLTDATGAAQANMTLSQQRAVTVAGALRQQGLPAPSFEIEAGGEAGAMSSDGHEDPVRRRAEVFLEVQPQ
jgi:peptidoglycan-associated lipoprotein